MINLHKTVSPQSAISFRTALVSAVLTTIGLWWILIADAVFHLNLRELGVYPADVQHLAGVFTAPLIHGSWMHLVSNSLPLTILLTAALYRYPHSMKWALPLIYIGSGLGVWWFGREALHYGASGVTHGLMFFIFLGGALRRDKAAIAISLGTFFLYGSMIWSIFPDDPTISYEYHLFGAITGVAGAILFRNKDKPKYVKKYDWEGDESLDDPVIGDQWRLEDDSNEPKSNT